MSAPALPPLSVAERARVEKNVELVKALMPELADSIKALRAAGFEIGWRNVAYIGPHRPAPPNCVNAGQMVLESASALKERIGLNGHR